MKKLIAVLLFSAAFISKAQNLFMVDLYTEAEVRAYGFMNHKYGKASQNYCNAYGVPGWQYGAAWRPLLIIVPGSGFATNGADRATLFYEMESTAIHFAKKGYYVVVMDYQRYTSFCSVGSNVNEVWFKGAQDVYAAIKYWTQPNIAGPFKINVNQVYILGQSAGGIAASPVAMNTPQQIQNEVGNAFGAIDANTYNSLKDSDLSNNEFTVAGLGLLSSGIPNVNLFNLTNSASNKPKIFSVHSQNDETVYYNNGSGLLTWPAGSSCTLSMPSLRGGGWIHNNYNGCRGLYYLTNSNIKHKIRDLLPPLTRTIVDNYFTGAFHTMIWGNTCYVYSNRNSDFYFIGKKADNEPATSTIEINKNTTIAIYPNPFTNAFRVKIADFSADTYTLKVIDVLGKTVAQELLTMNDQQISIIGQKAGVYSVQLYKNDNLINHQKVVKTK